MRPFLIWLMVAGALAWMPGAMAQTQPAPKAAAARGCLIAEFRTIGLSVHNPADRTDRAWNWLRTHARRCSLEQLQTVSNNRASWLGSSDSPEIMGYVDAIIEYRTQGNEEGLKALFNTPPPDNPTAKVSTGLPQRPAPVVQAGVPVPPVNVFLPDTAAPYNGSAPERRPLMR